MFANRVGGDCPHPIICVTSLNMRKWMRDRLQRKKKAPEQGSQPAPPPLQPAYFDADQVPTSVPESDHLGSSHDEREVPAASKPEFEAQPSGEESANTTEQSRRPVARAEGQRGRGRRRRGGRGRGGRGREQAVAQAFSPAAAKGIVPDLPVPQVDEGSEEAADTAEPEAQAVPQSPPVPAAAAKPRPPKGIVVLAIGLPGSGKSSWFKRHNVIPLSSDMIRSLLFDDVREQRFQDLVFSNLRSMLKARLIAKRPMNYVDATNLTPQERQHWIKLAKDYNYEVHAVFFDVPLEVCVERHQRRDRVVPEDVMRRMAAKLKAPAFDEGFAKITVVRVKKKD
jgi:predicted kinase